jgi:hypothetical protein
MGGTAKRAMIGIVLAGTVMAVLLIQGCKPGQGRAQETSGATSVVSSPGSGMTAETASLGTSTTAGAAPDLSALIKQMAQPYPAGDPRYASSNPYDYIKDNPAFDAVVAMGYDALPALEADLTAGALGKYLDCIAIESITKCDLKQFEQFTWADAQGFRTQWNRYLEQMPSMVTAAFALSSYYPPRPLGIERLGAPAVPYVIDRALQSPGVGNPDEVLHTLQMLLLNAKPGSTIAEFAELNRVTIEKLRAYVENR